MTKMTLNAEQEYILNGLLTENLDKIKKFDFDAEVKFDNSYNNKEANSRALKAFQLILADEITGSEAKTLEKWNLPEVNRIRSLRSEFMLGLMSVLQLNNDSITKAVTKDDVVNHINAEVTKRIDVLMGNGIVAANIKQFERDNSHDSSYSSSSSSSSSSSESESSEEKSLRNNNPKDFLSSLLLTPPTGRANLSNSNTNPSQYSQLRPAPLTHSSTSNRRQNSSATNTNSASAYDQMINLAEEFNLDTEEDRMRRGEITNIANTSNNESIESGEGTIQSLEDLEGALAYLRAEEAQRPLRELSRQASSRPSTPAPLIPGNRRQAHSRPNRPAPFISRNSRNINNDEPPSYDPPPFPSDIDTVATALTELNNFESNSTDSTFSDNAPPLNDLFDSIGTNSLESGETDRNAGVSEVAFPQGVQIIRTRRPIGVPGEGFWIQRVQRPSTPSSGINIAPTQTSSRNSNNALVFPRPESQRGQSRHRERFENRMNSTINAIPQGYVADRVNSFSALSQEQEAPVIERTDRQWAQRRSLYQAMGTTVIAIIVPNTNNFAAPRNNTNEFVSGLGLSRQNGQVRPSNPRDIAEAVLEDTGQLRNNNGVRFIG
jgi:hypothetical protein